jgi:ACS family hexuronate transporter-like MFS transporter
VVLSRFFLDPVWWLFVNWLPIYLSERFLFDVKTIGAFAWVPYVGAAAGSLLGGVFSSRLIKRNRQAVPSRIVAVTVGCIVMLPCLVLTAFATTAFTAIGLITLILFGFQFAISNIQTLPSDFYDGRNVGTVTGMSGTAAVAGVLVTTWLVPALTRHGYFWFFLLGAMLVPLAFLSVWLLSPAGEGRTGPHRMYKTTDI